MARLNRRDAAPIRGIDDLLAPFEEAFKPRSRWRVGTEAEKFGVFVDTGQPLPFDGERSVRHVLAELVDRHGWFEEREVEGGDVISLRRGEASITLEPGGQLELSGAPLGTIHQTCGEFRGHMAELRDISDEMGVAWLGLGFHPFAKRDELPWVPKLRYTVMREYLPTRGKLALSMMQRTCTVQANIDYESEKDAMRKLRVALALQPIVTAMFANSPFVEGRPTGERSHRALSWLDVDPDRTGLLAFAWGPKMSFERYVEWALDVPMFLVKRGDRMLRNTGQTFRAFMKDGFDGEHATRGDWETHLNTLFPEVRLKKTIEMRGADGQSTHMNCALPALWKGLLYDAQALSRAETMASRLTYKEVEAARPEVANNALRARLGGREIAEWANELVEVAAAGLGRMSNLNRSGEDETIHLARLRALVSKGMCPADELLASIDASRPLLPQLLDKARV